MATTTTYTRLFRGRYANTTYYSYYNNNVGTMEVIELYEHTNVLLYAFATSLLRSLCNYYLYIVLYIYTNWYRYNNTLIRATAAYYICIYNLKGCDGSIFAGHIIIYTILSCNILCFYAYTQYVPCMSHNDESDFSTRSHDFFGKAKKAEKKLQSSTL